MCQHRVLASVPWDDTACGASPRAVSSLPGRHCDVCQLPSVVANVVDLTFRSSPKHKPVEHEPSRPKHKLRAFGYHSVTLSRARQPKSVRCPSNRLSTVFRVVSMEGRRDPRSRHRRHCRSARRDGSGTWKPEMKRRSGRHCSRDCDRHGRILNRSLGRSLSSRGASRNRSWSRRHFSLVSVRRAQSRRSPSTSPSPFPHLPPARPTRTPKLTPARPSSSRPPAATDGALAANTPMLAPTPPSARAPWCPVLAAALSPLLSGSALLPVRVPDLMPSAESSVLMPTLCARRPHA